MAKKLTRKPRRRRSSAQKSDHLDFSVESLEDRRLLATFTVTTAADVVDSNDQVTSLREAIQLANAQAGADTVNFDASVFTGGENSLIRLDGAELVITDSLTIDASAGGAVGVTITGDALGDDTVSSGYITDLSQTEASELDDNSRVLNFSAASGDLSLTGLAITGGRITGGSEIGGGIRFGSSGNLMLTSGLVSGNSTSGTYDQGYAEGGGIGTTSGHVTLMGSTVSGNSSIGNGGGIRTHSGNVELTDSTVSGNSSDTRGGGIRADSGRVELTNTVVSGNTSNHTGGGINTNSGNVTLANSTVIENHSSRNGAGIRTHSGTVRLTDSTVSGNSSGDRGGGIAAFTGDVTLTSSTISGNRSSGNGGGIYLYAGAVTLTNGTVSGNRAYDNFGGGLYGGRTVTINNTTITANSSETNGGGVVSFGSTTFNNTIIVGNSAPGGAADFAGTGSNFSGSFNLLGSGNSVNGSNNIVIDVNVTDPGLASLADNGGPTQTHALLAGSMAIDAGNSAQSTDQRRLTRPADNPNVVNAPGGNGSDIGAVEMQEAPSLMVTTATDSVDSSDFATSLREAIHFANSQTGADVITFDSILSGQTIALAGTHLEITDSLTIDASALTGNVTIDAQQGSRVIRFHGSNGDLALNQLTLTGGRETVSYGYGGGIFFESTGNLTLTGSTVINNHTADRGGGIHTFSGRVTLDSSTVSGNSSQDHGGGIATSSGVVTLNNSTVSGNNASRYGGGIWTGGSGDVTLTGSTVSGNSSGRGGGGIRTYSGNLVLRGSTVSGNTSGRHGGGIYTFSGSVMLTGSTISGNSTRFADSDGGGIWAAVGNVSLTSSTVSGNSSEDEGGGIFTSGGTVTLVSSTVANNSAAHGGGVYVRDTSDDPALEINSSIIAGNTSTASGADLVLDPDAALTVDFTLIGDTTGTGIDANTGTGNVLNQAAMLSPLADNGGPTQTHALMIDSPAVDRGSNPLGLTTDQRGAGFARVNGASADMGAFELFDTTPGVRLIDGTLYVFGTEGRDNINVRTQGEQIRVRSRMNLGTPDSTNTTDLIAANGVNDVAIYLRGGRDMATLNRNIALATHIDGGSDNDSLRGGSGANTLVGGLGNDLLRGGAARDVLIGGAGNDRLFGLAEADVLSGGAGNDRLVGGIGATQDVLVGGEGEDRLIAGAGNDLLVGHSAENEGDSSALRSSLDEWLSINVLPTSLGSLVEDGVQDHLIGGAGDDLLVGDTEDVLRP